MGEKKKAILLRIPADLADALQRWAADELRSVNSQVEYLLREAVRKRGGGRALAGVPGLSVQELLARVGPFVQQVIAELRNLGLTEWGQRLERAISFSNAPGEALLNLRATLAELNAAEVILPDEVRRVVRGVLGTLTGLAE